MRIAIERAQPDKIQAFLSAKNTDNMIQQRTRRLTCPINKLFRYGRSNTTRKRRTICIELFKAFN
jgi:hypothetical protein